MDMTRAVVTPGTKFGRLEVIGEAAPRLSAGQQQRCVECRCDCGAIGVYRLYSLKNGNTQSCGCLAREVAGQSLKTHGMSKLPEYRIWLGLLHRCRDLTYRNYGARGINVCDRWKQSFEAFFADMGKRPSPKHSIDRFPNNNGDYEPGNCRWATQKEQMRNTRFNHLIEHNGERKCIGEWAEQYKVLPVVLYARLVKLGWTFEEAVGLRNHIRHSYGDPFYRIPLEDRGPGWYQEHERREVERIAQARQEMGLYGDDLAKFHCVDATEFKSRVDKALVDGESRHDAIYRALREMGAA
jgi:hypothetical protein